MDKSASLPAITRLLVGLISLALVAAPFAANCCALPSCEGSRSVASSDTHCHEAMSSPHRVDPTCHGKISACGADLPALEVIVGGETAGGTKLLKNFFLHPQGALSGMKSSTHSPVGYTGFRNLADLHPRNLEELISVPLKL
jgi:hypothetical protein